MATPACPPHKSHQNPLRPPMAAPETNPRRLVDSLTAHIALYTSTAAATTPTPRAAVLRWFAALHPPHRQAALTISDHAFLQILLNMHSRLLRSGHGSFLLLPDLPDPSRLPSLVFRRSRGLLARAAAANEPDRTISRALRLFSSGSDSSRFRCSPEGLDACTMAEELVRDVDWFVEVMDGVSGGAFLRGEEKGMGEEWFEFGWLKNKGYYSLEAFVANKLELALRLSWMSATGGKRRGGAGKVKEDVAGIAANVFWRKKGCVDWWDRMEPNVKEKVLRVVFGKSAKTLAFEVAKVVQDTPEDGAVFYSLGRRSSVRYGPINSWSESSIDFCTGKLTPVTNRLISLTILHEISIAMSDRLHLKTGEEFLFSSLSSVFTISDCVLRGVRALLGAMSSDYVKLELLTEETSKVSQRRSKKKVKKDRNKKQIPAAEKPLTNEKPFKADAKRTDSEGCSVPNADDLHADCRVERRTEDYKGDQCTKILSTDFVEVHRTEKKNRRKTNKRKKTRFKEAIDDKQSQKRSENTSSAAAYCDNELHGILEVTCRISDNVNHDPLADHVDNNYTCEDRTINDSRIIINVEAERGSASLPLISSVEVERVYHKSDTGAPEDSIVKEPIFAHDVNRMANAKEAMGYLPPASTVGGLSYEWPSWRPVYYPSAYSSHLPYATDRLHLDVGHDRLSQLNQTYLASRHQTRNSFVDNSWGQTLPTGLDSTDDCDSHWAVDEETDFHTLSGRDYNQFFGGGIMYWNPVDVGSTGFSRPPSLSSEDSSWAWHEAELSRVVDDMVGLSSSYGANGLTSPTAAPFCSPFDPAGPTQQPVGFVIPGNDALVIDASVEDKVSGTSNITAGGFVEVIAADSLPYPILRPIIVPSISKEESGSEYKLTCDRRSPFLPPTRRETPRMKRPPSPVIRCIPQSPRPPPPSPVSDSRKHRGFPGVRSGSSSPRHWGIRSWYHDVATGVEDFVCANGGDVIWSSWRSKGVGPSKMVQPLASSLLQDRILSNSQLAVDHDHPDLSLPLQPPNMPTSHVYKACMSIMHSILHEEIDSFCTKMGDAILNKKPYINWAVKRVARSLQVLWPRSRTTIFGSNATGLALPSSDVDLVICLPPVRNLEPIKEAGILEGRNGIKETCLQHAARYLGNQEWVKSESLKVVENTAIPVIMLVAEVPHDYVNANGSSPFESAKTDSEELIKDNGNVGHFGLSEPDSSLWQFNSTIKNKAGTDVRLVRLDISFMSPAHTGLRTTDLVRELIEQFPAAAPLALVIKQFLADRSLDHSYSGGLSSYCLVLLIIRFLQHEHHIGRSTTNLGSLLMDFLHFFGNVFDPRQMRVSIQGSGVYVNRERGHSIDPLHIDDPLCPMNNVGRNCFRIHQCVKAFADAYTVLENEISRLSPDNDDSIGKDPVKLLPKIIPSMSPLYRQYE